MVIRMPVVRAAIAAGMIVCALGGAAVAGGLDAESNTDGFDPAVEAYRIGEARRQSAMARQLDLVYRMQWENPYFLGGGPIRQPIGYESKQLGPNRWIYRPIYAEDVAPAADELPAPEQATQKAPAVPPQPPAPSDAAPEDFIGPPATPQKPARRGPREF
jgi:hypothetical protein